MHAVRVLYMGEVKQCEQVSASCKLIRSLRMRIKEQCISI